MHRVLIIALAAILSLYAIVGFFMRFEADDYCEALGGRESGILGFTIKRYNTWEGRYGQTLVSLTLYKVLGSTGPAILPATLITMMVAAWWWLLRHLLPRHALMLAMALTLGFITGVPNIWQSFYWMIASLNYILPVIGALLVGGWLLRWGVLRRVLSLQASTSSGDSLKLSS